MGIVGAGTMGAGIALAFARSGFQVLLHDANPKGLDAGLARIASILESQVAKGRMTPAEAAQANDRLVRRESLAALVATELIVEAIIEDLPAKQQLMKQLGSLCAPDTMIASNTSTLDIDVLAAASGRPRETLGMHFFSPAHIMRLVEVVRGRETSSDALASALGVVERIGKLGVIVGNGFGFVGNRMLYAYGREKEMLLLEGATPEQIDRALEDFGMAMGPNAVGDLSGLDVGAHARRQWKDRPLDPRYYRVTDLLVEQGRLGQKTGRGFYHYEGERRERHVDPDVIDMIRSEAHRLNVPQRTVGDAEIVERCMLALINEGVWLLERGVAARGADIDVIWCNGYGFPRGRGGPMSYADTLGLPQVLQTIARYGRDDTHGYWKYAPMLTRLATTGGRLSDAAAGSRIAPDGQAP